MEMYFFFSDSLLLGGLNLNSWVVFQRGWGSLAWGGPQSSWNPHRPGRVSTPQPAGGTGSFSEQTRPKCQWHVSEVEGRWSEKFQPTAGVGWAADTNNPAEIPRPVRSCQPLRWARAKIQKRKKKKTLLCGNQMIFRKSRAIAEMTWGLYRIPLTGNVQNTQMLRDREQIRLELGLGGGEWGAPAKEEGLFAGWGWGRECFGIGSWWGSPSSVY